MIFPQNTKPIILSLSGLVITDSERDLFKESQPLGFILFKRNIDSPEQVKALVSDLKETLGWDCPILIDQEGGRVQRLGPPDWPEYPTMQSYKDHNIEALEKDTARIAQDLKALGMTVNCAPVLDVLSPETHDVIGDRAFSDEVETVSKLGDIVCRTYLENGVTPIIKHIPGHGCASADSHLELPVVKKSKDDLTAKDFAPFQSVSAKPYADRIWAMTAHVLYHEYDSELPASLSPVVTDEIMRNHIGFNGLLIGDDISMNALERYGSLSERASKILSSGSDIALYCAGIFEEMDDLMGNIDDMKPESRTRFEASWNTQRLAA